MFRVGDVVKRIKIHSDTTSNTDEMLFVITEVAMRMLGGSVHIPYRGNNGIKGIRVKSLRDRIELITTVMIGDKEQYPSNHSWHSCYNFGHLSISELAKLRIKHEI